MNMSWIDWSIVVGMFAIVVFAAQFTMKYTKSVADFLAASRCAGRYLLVIAEGIASLGAVAFIAMWEIYYEAGFSAGWWGQILIPVYLGVFMSGFVICRYRQTRAMTLAQFFEMRYSRRFRILAGCICFISGALNFGVFPAVGARFFVYFCGLPAHIPLVGGYEIATFPTIMFILLVAAVTFAWMGGQIAVMVTDFVQGFFVNIAFVIIAVAVVLLVDWSKMSAALLMAPAEQSMVNPFKGGQIKNFNLWFYVILGLQTVYGYMSWQGSQGYNCAAKNAHEAQMSKVLVLWRNMGMNSVCILLPLLAYTVMHHVNFTELAGKVNSSLSTIPGGPTGYLQDQLTVPIALSLILPIGIKGLMCAVMLAAFLSTHVTCLHSWGSIFIQDVIMPLRKKPLDAASHLKLLRFSILGVAVWIFFFGWFYPQNAPIMMFWAVTGAIWAGAGSAIIGGLYWKKGTTAGAYVSLIVGAVLGLASLAVGPLWPKWYGHEFPINGQILSAIVIFCSAFTYIIFSLIQNRVCDMDRLFHRGKYAVESEGVTVEDKADFAAEGGFWHKLGCKLGMTRSFTFWDKVIFVSSMVFNFGSFVVFVVVTLYGLFKPISDSLWLKYWLIMLYVNIIGGALTTIWMAVGGIIDLKSMFRTLATAKRDEHDDGTVVKSSQ
jgi:SSS family solute:Na+ symporter